jgi:hypothetical protein
VYHAGNPAPTIVHGAPAVIDYSRGQMARMPGAANPGAVALIQYTGGQPPKTVVKLSLPQTPPVTGYKAPHGMTPFTGAPPFRGGIGQNQVPGPIINMGSPGQHMM